MAPRSARAVASCLLLLGLATADSFALLQQQQQQQRQRLQQRQPALARAAGVCAGTAPPASSFLQPLPSRGPLRTLHATAAALDEASSKPVPVQALSVSMGGLLSKRRGGAVAAAGAAGAGEKSLWERTRVWVFIGLWYFFNVAFNIYNKKVTVCGGLVGSVR